jgi:hypothetical protein
MNEMRSGEVKKRIVGATPGETDNRLEDEPEPEPRQEERRFITNERRELQVCSRRQPRVGEQV